jgi:hypothetical protein
MALLHCPYCHLEVEDASFEAHIKSHTRIRPDGQLTTYKTLKPEGRELGDISDVPQTYYHIRCGVGTIMPEEIVRSYLVNPYLYSNVTYCGGCQEHVPYTECYWEETKENLQAYFDGLRALKPELKPKLISNLPSQDVTPEKPNKQSENVAGIILGILFLAVGIGLPALIMLIGKFPQNLGDWLGAVLMLLVSGLIGFLGFQLLRGCTKSFLANRKK